jgi:hypothetical protein
MNNREKLFILRALWEDDSEDNLANEWQPTSEIDADYLVMLDRDGREMIGKADREHLL